MIESANKTLLAVMALATVAVTLPLTGLAANAANNYSNNAALAQRSDVIYDKSSDHGSAVIVKSKNRVSLVINNADGMKVLDREIGAFSAENTEWKAQKYQEIADEFIENGTLPSHRKEYVWNGVYSCGVVGSDGVLTTVTAAQNAFSHEFSVIETAADNYVPNVVVQESGLTTNGSPLRAMRYCGELVARLEM